jgi:4-amino-4-deoxychorismate lyase
VTKTDLNIHISGKLDRGLSYGESCFETFRVIDGNIFCWQQHVSRLAGGLKCFGIVLSDTDFESIHERVFHHAEEVSRDVLVRVTVTGGEAKWGLARNRDQQPEVYIQCLPSTSQGRETSISTVEWPFAIQAKTAKFTSDYALILRAMQSWNDGGLVEGVTPLVCKDGRVLSTLTSNVLIYRQGGWHTPDEASGGILPGIVRNELVAGGIIELSECPVPWLDDCEAVALSNSGFFVRPVSSVNGRALDRDYQIFESLYQALRGKPGVSGL